MDRTAMIPPTNVYGGTPYGGPGQGTPQRPSWAKLPEQGRRAAVEDEPSPQSTQRRKILLSAAVALMVFVVAGTVWYLTLGRYTDAPALVNMTKAQAELYAKQNNFQIFYAEGANSDTVAKDTVIKQDPGAGEKLVKGGAITVTLSLGPQSVPAPDVVGHEQAAATAELTQAGLKVKVGTAQYSDTVPAGSIISTDPASGTQLKHGDTVTVVVSKGQAPIQVPDLVGKNINDARSTLQQLGLTAVERYQDSDQPADTVLAQTPKANTGVVKNSEVTLDVSKGPQQVTVPDLTNQQCQQAQAALQGMGLQVQIIGNGNANVHFQNPGGNTPVAPGSAVQLTCF